MPFRKYDVWKVNQGQFECMGQTDTLRAAMRLARVKGRGQYIVGDQAGRQRRVFVRDRLESPKVRPMLRVYTPSLN